LLRLPLVPRFPCAWKPIAPRQLRHYVAQVVQFQFGVSVSVVADGRVLLSKVQRLGEWATRRRSISRTLFGHRVRPQALHGDRARLLVEEVRLVTFALNADGTIASATMAPVSPATDFSFDFQDLLLKPAKR
jgi:hypothetical protein